jgi:competence protein ComEA
MEPPSTSRRRALAGAAVAVGVLALAGRHLAGGGAPAAPPPAALERAAPAPAAAAVVHVVGAVRRPGLYRLTDGSRVADALRRAGGAMPVADLSAVNLAAPVADGTQVVVPARAPEGAAGGEGEASAGGLGGPVHLNTATLEELDELPGVGPVTAQKIVEWREKHGAFASVDDLDAIPGIGPARLEQLRELVAP